MKEAKPKKAKKIGFFPLRFQPSASDVNMMSANRIESFFG